MLRKILLVLYTAFALGANAAHAEIDLKALAEGDMKKLALHDQPIALPDADLLDENDAASKLSDWHGNWLVINFWATWCAPCREEMPSLMRLQQKMPEIRVLPIATGRNSVAGIQKFFEKAGIVGLPIRRDPSSELARAMGIAALPVTIIVNPEGKEVARLIGDADWDSESAIAMLKAISNP